MTDTRKCVRCKKPMTDNCTDVCVPCLLKQGNEYQRTGNVKAFFEVTPTDSVMKVEKKED